MFVLLCGSTALCVLLCGSTALCVLLCGSTALCVLLCGSTALCVLLCGCTAVRFGIGQQPAMEDMEVEVEGEEEGEGRGPFTIDLTHPGYRQDHLDSVYSGYYIHLHAYFQARRAGIRAVYSGVGGLGLHLLTEKSQDQDYMKI